MSAADTSPSQGKIQIGSLQILRAAAALSVFFFHYFAYLQVELGVFDINHFEVGAFGVDIFFVVSGFIICYASEQEHSPLRFMLKRMSRILPLYYVLTLGIFSVALVAPQLLYSTTANIENLVKSLLFIPYAKENGLMQPLLFLGWTLNYEMFFYLVFALSMFAGRFRIPVLLTVISALVVYGATASHTSVPVLFFTSGIMLNFAWGCLAYLAYRHVPVLLKIARPLWPVAIAVMLLQNYVPLGLPREVSFGLPAMVLLLGLLTTPVRDGPVSKFFVSLGDASYSLYLIHPYILQALFKILIPAIGISWWSITLFSVLAFGIAVVACTLMFHLVERPSNEWLRSRLFASNSRLRAA